MEPTVWRHAKMNNCPIVSWGMDALTKTLTYVCLFVCAGYLNRTNSTSTDSASSKITVYNFHGK